MLATCCAAEHTAGAAPVAAPTAAAAATATTAAASTAPFVLPPPLRDFVGALVQSVQWSESRPDLTDRVVQVATVFAPAAMATAYAAQRMLDAIAAARALWLLPTREATASTPTSSAATTAGLQFTDLQDTVTTTTTTTTSHPTPVLVLDKLRLACAGLTYVPELLPSVLHALTGFRSATPLVDATPSDAATKSTHSRGNSLPATATRLAAQVESQWYGSAPVAPGGASSDPHFALLGSCFLYSFFFVSL